MEFIKKNKNPKLKRASDCVVRAIAEAEDKEWKEVFKELVEISLKKYDMPNTPKVYEKYLKDLGYIKQKMPKKPNGKRYTIKEYFNNYNGIVIVSVARHLTCIRNGNLIDIWDCSNKSICNYWIKEK